MLRGATIDLGRRPLFVSVVLLGSASSAAAQADTTATPAYRLEDIAVVGHRTAITIRESASAVDVLTREMIESLPARTIADVLALVPGLVFLERDGAGQLPMAIARGFFGGGETSYVLLLIDGVPVNDVSIGTVEWTAVPVEAIERIEVQRGGGSSLYGDAAMGAVINVVTRTASPATRLSADSGLGTWNDRRLGAGAAVNVGIGRLTIDARYGELDGYRAHAGSTDISASAAYSQPIDRPFRVRSRLSATRIEKEEPGALTLEEAEADPRRADPLFDADDRRRDAGDLSVGFTRSAGAGRIDGDMSLRLVDETSVRTLRLAPGFGDTQRREMSSRALWGRIQGDFDLGSTSIVVGVEADRGSYDGRYLEPTSSALISRADGARTRLGAFGELRRSLVDRWSVFLGSRFDYLSLDTDRGIATATFSRVSPRVGTNIAFSAAEGSPGNVFASWTLSFRAPTLDQLYGNRRIPTGTPGESISFSNPDLRPQTASGLEVGIRQRIRMGAGRAELTATAYRMEVDDEIDFDVATFSYGNILRSRHDGLEIGLSLVPGRAVALEHALNLARVVFRGGETDGNQLKNIPRTAAFTSLRYLPAEPLAIVLTHRFVGELNLDDANTVTIPGRNVFGLQTTWDFGDARLVVAGDNLFDVRTNSLGFTLFDPIAGNSVPYVYPAGGRSVRVAIRWSS